MFHRVLHAILIPPLACDGGQRLPVVQCGAGFDGVEVGADADLVLAQAPNVLLDMAQLDQDHDPCALGGDGHLRFREVHRRLRMQKPR